MFELHPSVSLSEEYTDNFGLSRRDTQENFRTSVSPGLALLINGAFTKGQIRYTLSGAQDSSRDDTSLFHSLQGQVNWQGTPRLRLTATDVLTRSDEPVLADALSLRRERRPFTSNTFSLTSDYLLETVATQEHYHLATFFGARGEETTTHRIGASASTGFYQTNTMSGGYDYLTSETGVSDITGHQVTASVARQLSAFASAGVSGSYAPSTFTDAASGVETDFRTWTVSLFNTYAIANRWSLTSSVGFSRLESDSPPSTSNLPTSITSFSYRFAQATATASVDQGFSQSFAQGQNFGIVKTKGVTGSFAYPLTPFISGSASAFYRENQFTGVGGGQARPTEDTWGGSISFAIRLLHWLAARLDYTHREATSSSRAGRSFSVNTARAFLTASF